MVTGLFFIVGLVFGGFDGLTLFARIWRLGAPPLRQRLPNCVWRVLIEDLTRFRDDDMSSCMLLVVVGLKKAVIAVSKEWMGMSVD